MSMFKVRFRERVLVDCHPESSKLWCWLYLDCDIPFKPCEDDVFRVGGQEVEVLHVYYDLDAQQFVIDPGGMLCDDEEQARQLVEDSVDAGWYVEMEAAK